MKNTHRIITARRSMQGCSEQPLTGFDIGNPVDGFSIALVYQQPLNEHLLIAGLQRTLDRIPYFSGRLFGVGSTLPLVIPNNEGALFTCTAYDEAMPVFDIDQPLKPYISRFVHRIENFGFDQHTPLLQIRLTNFSDGAVLGISISHLFCDGTAMIEFIRDWAANTLETESQPLPSWNRRDVQQMALGDGTHSSAQTPIVELSQAQEFNGQPIETGLFRLPAPLLEQLHRKYQSADNAISRQDIVTAFIFILMARCRAQPADPCSLTIVCNIRRVLELPSRYLGNAVSLRHFPLSAEQLDTIDVRSAASRIRNLYAEMTAESLRRDLAFWQKKMAEGSASRFMPLAIHLALNGGILIDNMSKFDFYELDFGQGQPTWLDTPPPPSPAPVSRGVLMLPAPPNQKGIDLHVSLPPAEMANFRALLNGFRAD